jgi:hypothetical protein
MLPLVLRWTVGDVSAAGYEALGYSITGAQRLFGTAARYIVCVNSIPLAQAQRLVGPSASCVEWRATTRSDIPPFIRARLDLHLAQGAGWKLAPLRIDANSLELSLDNDVILWGIPVAVRRWYHSGRGGCLVAADVLPSYGRFTDACGPTARNAGIRGLSVTVPFADLVEQTLASCSGMLDSELDEQGLQIAAICRIGHPLIVPTRDVTICSPFPPHSLSVGRCGVHLVGLNAKWLPWESGGRPATELLLDHWHRVKPIVVRRLNARAPEQRRA